MFDQLGTVSMLFPGILMSAPAMQIRLQILFAIYGTIWLPAFAFVIRTEPFNLCCTYTGMLQIHRELEGPSPRLHTP